MLVVRFIFYLLSIAGPGLAGVPAQNQKDISMRFKKIETIKAEFEKLSAQLKAFGTLCKYRDKKQKGECNHEDMGWGGLSRNTRCELRNCPRV